MAEMHDNRHTADLIYMHMLKFIYRSYRCTYYIYIIWDVRPRLDGHLISSFITIEMWPGHGGHIGVLDV